MRRYPVWLKKEFSPDGTARTVRRLLDGLELATVCESAVCPNLRECYSDRQLAFMILGQRCTRPCRFCAVGRGRGETVSADEPQRVAEAVQRLGLTHVVITSVTRDDLADEGAGQFVRVIEAVRERNPASTVEVLVPDFHARPELIAAVLTARPDVFAHNLETIERLTPAIRVHAQYSQSLEVLRLAARRAQGSLIKSSLMLGLGEREDEVGQSFDDLVEAGCTHLTLGQYLQPAAKSLPVVEYISPEQFAAYKAAALGAGLAWVMAGPFVRSSYHAFEAVLEGPHVIHAA